MISPSTGCHLPCPSSAGIEVVSAPANKDMIPIIDTITLGFTCSYHYEIQLGTTSFNRMEYPSMTLAGYPAYNLTRFTLRRSYEGTTAVLVKQTVAPKPELSLEDLPDTWND